MLRILAHRPRWLPIGSAASLFLALLSVCFPARAAFEGACDDPGPRGLRALASLPTERGATDFAIYHPAGELAGSGIEVERLQKFLARFGWTAEVVGPQMINNGVLDRRPFRALIMPGGSADARSLAISAAGRRSIERFIARGGSYLGFCAGSYYAARVTGWAQSGTAGGGRWNGPGDYERRADPRYLDLLPGVAKGPLGWRPWDGANAWGNESVRFTPGHPEMAASGAPSNLTLYYGGGPFFLLPDDDSVEILARAVMPPGVPPGSRMGAGQPTVVRFPYGRGRVLLFSYHPVFLPYPDPANPYQREANYQSWNVLHAALQMVLGVPVTPME